MYDVMKDAEAEYEIVTIVLDVLDKIFDAAELEPNAKVGMLACQRRAKVDILAEVVCAKDVGAETRKAQAKITLRAPKIEDLQRPAHLALHQAIQPNDVSEAIA
jgi:hypothetical protein